MFTIIVIVIINIMIMTDLEAAFGLGKQPHKPSVLDKWADSEARGLYREKEMDWGEEED